MPLRPALAAFTALSAAVALSEPPAGFKLEGTRFVFKDGRLDFDGVLFKPEGAGPFPAILISHGLGGGAEGFAAPNAREFVKRGFVCIAPNYTHAGGPGVKAAKAGDRKDFGAGDENFRRAAKCLDILEGLPYVDRKRIVAYGNSMGAFVTVGLSANEPKRLAAAAITAGGVAPRAGFPAPSEELAAKIKTPLLILHGTTDTTVRPEQSARLKEILDKAETPADRRLFEGVGHGLHNEKADEVYRLLSEWFAKHGGK